MNYKKYYDKLTLKNQERKCFPKDKIFKQVGDNKYTNKLTYENFCYNFTISTEKSNTYGNYFEGFIVEMLCYSENKYFMKYNELINFKDDIDREFSNNLFWQPKEESKHGTRWRVYAKLEADINNENNWDKYVEWQINTMIKFLEVFPHYTKELKKEKVIDMINKKEIITDTAIIKINFIKNIILYGSPGVGKTHNTNKLISLIESGQDEKLIFQNIKDNIFNDGIEANQITENIKDRIKFITFHQSFGYEDFIEGFRPNENGNITLCDGVFKTICQEAEKSDLPYYLVIDEINRGNISKIFGELITLIEEDKRDSFETILPYSKKPFKIPSNLFIIGTMNSTDKSIALIDIALRRRFTFLKMKPKDDLVPDIAGARSLFKKLNKYIRKTIGEDFQIGHSYFMKIKNKEDLEFTIEYKIIPLLEEYFYGDSDGLKKIKSLIIN